ncbi:calcium/proton exchanger [Cenococcum geophilum]
MAYLDLLIIKEERLKALKRNIPINILLLTIPIGFIVNYLYINGVTIFIVNFITIIPLTVMLSYTTKEITLRAGNTLGGLLNITFRYITFVKTSLISSMLLNLLFILSIYFFFKGINRIEQYFNIIVVDTIAGLLALYISNLIILTAFYSTLLTISPNSFILNLKLSYRAAVKQGMSFYSIVYIGVRAAAISKGGGAIITLKLFTILVAFYSEFIVNSISNITASGTIFTTFIGFILLLIIRNAAKYIIAVIVAYKDKISLVINVAIKSILPFIIILIRTNTFLITILFITILLINYLI